MTTENQANSTTNQSDQGCSVDWSWLKDRVIASATNDLQNLTITFEDGQTFKIQALNYKGQAFLAFTPYEDPKKK